MQVTEFYKYEPIQTHCTFLRICYITPDPQRGRVLSLFSSRPNWDPHPIPSHVVRLCTPPPPPLVPGETHSLSREGVRKTQFGRLERKLTLGIYVLCDQTTSNCFFLSQIQVNRKKYSSLLLLFLQA